jgi:hypothetical protein
MVSTANWGLISAFDNGRHRLPPPGESRWIASLLCEFNTGRMHLQVNDPLIPKVQRRYVLYDLMDASYFGFKGIHGSS